MFGYESVWPGQQAIAEPRYQSFSLKLKQHFPKFSQQSTGVQLRQPSTEKADQCVNNSSNAAELAKPPISLTVPHPNSNGKINHMNEENYLLLEVKDQAIAAVDNLARTVKDYVRFLSPFFYNGNHEVVDKKPDEASFCRCELIDNKVEASDNLASSPVTKESDGFTHSILDNDKHVDIQQSVTDGLESEIKEDEVVAVDSDSRPAKVLATSTTNSDKTACSSHHLPRDCPQLDRCDWQLGQLLRCIHFNEDISVCNMFNESWKNCKKKAACTMLQKAYTNCTEESCD